MINESIPKIKRENTLHEQTHFEVIFFDGSIANEQDTNWSSFSQEKNVKYQGGTKTVYVSNLPIKSITITHGELKTSIDIPEGHEVYQACKSESIFGPNGEKMLDRINGRVVGLIKDNEVIEERYLDGRGHQILGFRK